MAPHTVPAESDWLDGATIAPAHRVNRGRPAKDPANPRSRSRALECPDCGFKARASAGAIIAHGLPTCGCGTPLVMPELRDRIAIGDPEAVAYMDQLAAADAGRALERSAKRAERENASGYAMRAIPCKVCGRFKSRPADVCGHCGDAPAQYGSTDAERRELERVHNRGAGYAS